jgi:hypothetical protein
MFKFHRFLKDLKEILKVLSKKVEQSIIQAQKTQELHLKARVIMAWEKMIIRWIKYNRS